MTDEFRAVLEANRAKTKAPREQFERLLRLRMGAAYDQPPASPLPYDDRTLGAYLLDTIEQQMRDAYYAGRANAFAELHTLTSFDFTPTFKNSI